MISFKGKNGPAWARTVKYDITLDPMTDVGIKPLLEGYTKDKEHSSYDLKVRVDQYKHATQPDKYPKKFVTMFVADTKKGKVAAPTIEDLMDKLDQQQLRLQSSVDGKPRELFVKNSLYANDKVLELEYLLKKQPLTPEETQRLETLRLLVKQSIPPPKSTGANPAPPKSTGANPAAATAGAGQAPSPFSRPPGQPPPRASPPPSATSAARPFVAVRPLPAASASQAAKPLSSTTGGKHRTRHNRNRRNKTKRNKTNRN